MPQKHSKNQKPTVSAGRKAVSAVRVRPVPASGVVELVARRAVQNPVGKAMGQLLYQLGFYAECKLVQLWRGLSAAISFAGSLLVWALREGGRAIARFALRGARDFTTPVRRFGTDVRQQVEQGRERADKAAVKHGRAQVWLHIGSNLCMLMLPVLAAAVLFVTVTNILRLEYNLAVYVNGVLVGHVEDEATFEDARVMLRQRIVAADGKGQEYFQMELEYKLSSAAALTTKTQLVNNILYSYDTSEVGALVEATGFTIDGRLYVTHEGERLAAFLEELLESHAVPDVPDATVQYVKTIEYNLETDDVYFADSVWDYDALVKHLSSVEYEEESYTVKAGDTVSDIAHAHDISVVVLLAYNPALEAEIVNAEIELEGEYEPSPGTVLVVSPEKPMLPVSVSYPKYIEEVIPYTTVTEQSESLVIGSSRRAQTGSDGLQQTPYIVEILYGVETLVPDDTREPMILEPMVEEIIYEGIAQPVASGTVGGYSSAYMWPVPDYKQVSRGFLSYHNGLDITANQGTNIYASNAGTVLSADWHWSWGYNVLIDHGDGITTRYAHMTAMNVSGGDEVGQGQLIGWVGSTGESTGNHCHFEMMLNGSYVDPANYVSP